MDPSSFGANFSMVRDHLPLFGALLVGLPVLSLVSIRFWIAGRSAKVQRTSNWFVPTDLESSAAKTHFSMQNNSVAFARQVRRDSRNSVAVRNTSSRRSR